MKTKIFSLVLLTAILLLPVFVSAATADLIDIDRVADLTKSKVEVSFDIDNIADPGEDVSLVDISESAVEIEDNDGRILTASLKTPVPTEVLDGDSVTVTIELDVDSEFDYSDIDLGRYKVLTVEIDAEGQTSSHTEKEIVEVYFVNGYCDEGSFGDVDIIELEDEELDNEDAWDWHPLDDIEFEVEVENNFDDDDRFKVEWEIQDSDGKQVDFDEEDNEQSVSIDDGDSEKVTFNLRVPADIEDGDYKLFVKAYVKGHESDTDDPEAGCIDNSDAFSDTYYQKISIDRDEDRAVIVDIDKLETPDFVMCGDFATVYVKIYNIGTEDEDKVKVELYSSELDVDLSEVVNDLEEGESATVTFNFQVPENVEEKTYFFRLLTFFEYDEDDDEYDSNSKDDLDESFPLYLKVNCIQEKESKALITAELDSDAVAGQQLVIKGTLKNTGEEETTYSLRLSGQSSWAELDRIDPSSMTLEGGDSEEFLIYLNVDEDTSGEQFFTIKADHDSETTEQEVSVVIEGEAGALTGAAIGEHIRQNWFIWIIIIINIILIIAIILVARRIVTAR